MPVFVKIAPVDFTNASRDKRELSVAAELGYKIIVISKGNKRHIHNEQFWENHFLPTRFLPINPWFYNLNHLISFVYWTIYVCRFKADYISCHDIIALGMGYISNLFRCKKGKLIYDSHEFELARNTPKTSRGKLKIKLLSIVEAFLIKQCALSIMVNDSIAEIVAKIYKLNTKPLVIRNIPNYWNIDSTVCFAKRKQIMELLDISSEDSFILMYHGIITPNRGIEKVILSLKTLPINVVFVVLGNGLYEYLQELKLYIQKEGLEKRVLFLPAVTHSDLWKYVGAADVGMVNIDRSCKSYYLSLPNKLFENIQAEIPVIGSNFPEISKIITTYKVGMCIAPNDIDGISKAILEIKTNRELYCTFKNNTVQIKTTLCWEKEKEKLKEAYLNL